MHKKREMETENRGNRNTYKYKNLEATTPVVSVLFVPKTWGSVLQKRLQVWSLRRAHWHDYEAAASWKQSPGLGLGASYYKADSCLSCASGKENCAKSSTALYEVHCRACHQQAEADKATGKDRVDYIYKLQNLVSFVEFQTRWTGGHSRI